MIIFYVVCIRKSSFISIPFLFIQLGLVCFRLRGSDELNQKLLSTINASGRLHMVPASVNDKYVIRFCVCAQNATDDDIGRYSGMQK